MGRTHLVGQGRGFKVAKEEVIGLIRSLQIFVSEDEEAETRYYRRMCQEVVDAFIEIPGLDVSLEHEEYDYLIPRAVVNFTKGCHGLDPAQVYEAMAQVARRYTCIIWAIRKTWL